MPQINSERRTIGRSRSKTSGLNYQTRSKRRKAEEKKKSTTLEQKLLKRWHGLLKIT